MVTTEAASKFSVHPKACVVRLALLLLLLLLLRTEIHQFTRHSSWMLVHYRAMVS